ncbi:MAG: sugar transferase [Isosphaeraceae bacterium]|nr:sugar transferase [Isosphaeraceae bacterium]
MAVKPRTNHAFKRAIDVVVAALLLALLFPVLLAIAAVVKLTSGGPVIFRQVRVGKGGRRFVILKFRTLHTATPAYCAKPSSPSDARVTRAGRLLRESALDELPQLLNVLKGEMSLVGPRPEMPLFAQEYDALQRLRLEAVPGMTGLWQVATDRRGRIHDQIKYDLYYIHRQSLLLDVQILMQTVPVCLGGLRAIWARRRAAVVGLPAARLEGGRP